MSESNNNTSDNNNGPSFANGVTEAAKAAVQSVTDYANTLSENSRKEIINAAETEKVILVINTDAFATALDSYNKLVASFPNEDVNLASFDAAADSMKTELLSLTNQINQALNAHVIAKRKEIESNVKVDVTVSSDNDSNGSTMQGGRRMSKKRMNKMNKRNKSHTKRR
jgi:hypothetical protein